MTEPTDRPGPDETAAAEEPAPERAASLEALVDARGGWLTVPDVAERLDLAPSAVRRMIEEGELLAVRVGERRVAKVPAAFLDEDGPLPALRGTFTVLRDARMSDDEVVAWLFSVDETLPGGPTAVEAIRAGFKTEVRRRAMEEAL